MALSIATGLPSLAAPEPKGQWALSGHDAEVTSGCSKGRTMATCDSDGVMLVWQISDDGAIQNVCHMKTSGPACTDVTFLSATRLACSQGDASVSLWDVERGSIVHTFSRLASGRRSSWPVINAVAAVSDNVCCYGGDDGYLVWCDGRSKGVVSSSVNIKAPITALSYANDTVFVGTASGHLQWFDLRSSTGSSSPIDWKCSTEVITGLAGSGRGDRLVVHAMDGSLMLVDTQPFALIDSHRLLETVEMGAPDRQALFKCSWSDARDAVAVPSAAGVQCVRPSLLSSDPLSIRNKKSDESPNFAVFVDDAYVLFGGESSLMLQAW